MLEIKSISEDTYNCICSVNDFLEANKDCLTKDEVDTVNKLKVGSTCFLGLGFSIKKNKK